MLTQRLNSHPRPFTRFHVFTVSVNVLGVFRYTDGTRRDGFFPRSLSIVFILITGVIHVSRTFRHCSAILLSTDLVDLETKLDDDRRTDGVPITVYTVIV